MKYKNNKTKTGFTLVELAIVLVIIGLLIGGILVAQSMISTTRTLKMVRELQQYAVAANNFKTKYRFYPGDDPFFTPPGNGDGYFRFGAGGDTSFCNGVNNNLENYQVFPHLSQSGMLSANYVPYSDLFCGGTQTDNNDDAALAVVNEPYTNLSSKAAIGLDADGKNDNHLNKYPIIVFGPQLPGDGYDGYIDFKFAVNAEDVLALESKLKGSVNNDFGLGGCASTTYFPFVPCTASNAAFTFLQYYSPGV